VKPIAPPEGRGLPPRAGRAIVGGGEDAEREPSIYPGHCAPPRRGIFQVPRGGAGVATYVTLGGRLLRRGYAQARGTSGVRQEGLSPRNHLKDIEASKDWPPHLGVTKGKGYGL
jgi:hypothetical protein